MVQVPSSTKVLELDAAERSNLARLLRWYAGEQENAFDGLTDTDLRAELSADPTLAPDAVKLDEAEAAGENQRDRRRAAAVTSAEAFYALAIEVEQAGRLDLSDPGVRHCTSAAVDHSGYAFHDEFAPPPHELRRVVAIVLSAAQ